MQSRGGKESSSCRARNSSDRGRITKEQGKVYKDPKKEIGGNLAIAALVSSEKPPWDGRKAKK